MTKYSDDYIKDFWETRLPKSQNSLFLYIDNPFCISSCKYCIYSPQKHPIGGDIYNTYYSALISKLKEYEPILALKKPTGAYFGGGTASAMSTKTMRQVFDAIPRFNEMEYKGLECNPAITSDSKIDILIEYGFTYVSFGIQSMNKDVVESQDRYFYDIPRLQRQIKRLRENGIIVNCDLLAFMETGELSDLDLLAEDLQKVRDILKPDVNTIYPMYQRFPLEGRSRGKVNYTSPEQESLVVDKAFKFRKTVAKFLRKNSDLSLLTQEDLKTFLDLDDVRNRPTINCAITDHDKDSVANILKYNSSGYPNLPEWQDVIAFGGLSSRKIYGYAGIGFNYNSRLNLDTGAFEYSSLDD